MYVHILNNINSSDEKLEVSYSLCLLAGRKGHENRDCSFGSSSLEQQ